MFYGGSCAGDAAMQMPLKTIVISFFVITALACCTKKSSRQLPFEDGHANSALLQQYAAAKQYDSVLLLGNRWLNNKIAGGNCDTAMILANTLYKLLADANALQKKLMLNVYGKRGTIEKDTAALRKMHALFAGNYFFDHFNQVYDEEYTGIAEYFIALARKFPFLNADIGGFYQTLGISYNIAGDLKKAGGYYAMAYESDLRNYYDTTVVNHKGYLSLIPSSVQNMCTALNEGGKADSALKLIAKTLKLDIKKHYNLSGLYIQQCESYLVQHDPVQALISVKHAEDHLPMILQEASDDEDTIKRFQKRNFEILLAKTMIAAQQHDHSAYLSLAQKTLSAIIELEGSYHERFIGKTLLQLGSAYKQNSKPDSAVWFFHQALFTVAQVDSSGIYSFPAEKNIYAENTIMDALDSLAMMWDEQYVQTKQVTFLKKALQARKLAFIAERKLFEAFSYDESMKSQLLLSKKRSENALNNCWLLWQSDHDRQWIEQAILMNENSKAIALLHSLKKNTALNNLQEQDSMAVSLSRNRLSVITLEKELNSTTDPSRKMDLQNQLKGLYDQGLLWENELRSRLPGYKRTGIDTSLLSLDAIKKRLLDKQTCLLQYFRADSGAFVVWLDGEQSQGIKWLPESSLRIVDSFTAACRKEHGLYERDQSAFFSLAKNCTDIALPDGIQQQIKNGQYKKLLIIPDGGFSMLPFDALTLAGDQFLVRFSTVHTGYSISTLLANDATKTKTGEMTVFAPFTKTGNGSLQRLEFSQDEANAIYAAKKQAIVYTDTTAGINRFRQALGSSGIIHIATHATGNDSVQQVNFNDAALDVTELYASRTNAELVVLNGCETGAGRLDPNEGPLSLARGFYYAGARNVINSLWQIDDLASAGMFGNFYNHYAGKTGAALHNAKLNYLNTNSGRLKAPYYWAGLVHTGIDTEQPGSKKSWWWIFPVVLAIIVSVVLAPLIYKRRRL